MENKQTAVEWLVDNLPSIQQEGLRDTIDQALQMEKEQIEDAFTVGVEFEVYNNPLKTGQQYYTETYGKQTDRS